MKRIVVYAKGKIFKRNYKILKNYLIVAIVDKNVQQEEVFENIPVFFPDKLPELEYDYVIVFSNKLFDEIVADLVGTYFVVKEKIISWRTFISKENMDYVANDIVRGLMQHMNPMSILCIGRDGLSNCFMHKSELNVNKHTCLDKLITKNETIRWQIYDNVYKEINQCRWQYDVIFVTDWQLFRDGIVNRLQSKYIVVMTPYLLDGEKSVWEIKPEFDKYGNVKYCLHNSGIAWLINRKHLVSKNYMTKIYVVTHKNYNVLSNDLYTPINVGDEIMNKQWLTDSKGDNISYLNEKINECTALYWIWKNATDEIIGLNHYRRYFYSNKICCFGNFLNKSEIKDILEEYDFILPQAEPFYNVTVREQLMETIPNKQAFEEGYKIVKRLIEEKQPEYLEAFNVIMESHNFYRCNMFVTRKELLDQYCEWLFSFLIGAAESIDISKYDDYSKRVIGFFAERMLTVWLYKNPYRIKELPIALW